MTESSNRAELVLLLTPTGRDAALIGEVLRQAHLATVTCRDAAHLVQQVTTQAGMAVVAEECLRYPEMDLLVAELVQQPPWSDFPFIVLTSGGQSTRSSLANFERLQTLGNVTLLERPVRTVTLLSAVQSALRARRRQYEVEAYIEERREVEAALLAQAEELVRSNADLQQFAYITSHDLQEPLRTITSFTQLLARRYQHAFDDEAHEFVSFITSGITRMQALIEDLLVYSRVVNMEARPLGRVSMTTVVYWATQNLQLAIADSGGAIAYRDLPEVWGDQVQLVQLLQNLLSNAIKYRGPQPPEVTVTAARQGTEWLFSIKDNGLGIAPEYHERIFGVFKRLHGRDVPGTGIGLAICRKIIEKHQGRLWVESQVGEGATFRFTLPAIE